MKEKLRRFMYGRYGADQFSKFLVGVSFAGILISLFTGWDLFYFIAVAALIYAYFRMFSRNSAKRIAENQKYWAMTAKIRNKWQAFKWSMGQRKTHHIYKCPTCGQKIRIPKGKGRIEVTCPKCKTTFIKKS